MSAKWNVVIGKLVARVLVWLIKRLKEGETGGPGGGAAGEIPVHEEKTGKAEYKENIIMPRRVCRICGEFEENHHIPSPQWLEIPDGCVCDWKEWDWENIKSLPPICKEYKGDGEQNCVTCEHDKECHKG